MLKFAANLSFLYNELPFMERFAAAAKDRRGVVAWVEREGSFALGDTLSLHIPDQRVWAHLDEARKA